MLSFRIKTYVRLLLVWMISRCECDSLLCAHSFSGIRFLTILVLHLQGLISGSAELREQAALGLGELIEVTSEQALKEFVIPITGYVWTMFPKFEICNFDLIDVQITWLFIFICNLCLWVCSIFSVLIPLNFITLGPLLFCDWDNNFLCLLEYQKSNWLFLIATATAGLLSG